MAERVDILKGVLLIQQQKMQKLFNSLGDTYVMYDDDYKHMGDKWNKDRLRCQADIDRIEREIAEIENEADEMYWAGVEESDEFWDEHIFDKHQDDDYERADFEQFGVMDDKADTDDILTGLQYDIDGEMKDVK